MGATERFSSAIAYWDAVYQRPTVHGAVFRRRRDTALEWIERLEFPPGPRVLDLGCGAGHVSLALAQSGFWALAVDVVPGMVAQTRAAAAHRALSKQLRTAVADAQAQPILDEAFDLVVALGLFMWLPDSPRALSEVARVLRPGGYLILSASNSLRLDYALDPLSTPKLRRFRAGVRRLLRWEARSAPSELLHSAPELERLLAQAGLQPVMRVTSGFGPFTLFGRRVVPEILGVFLDRILQRGADTGAPLLPHLGAEHLVVARKSATQPSAASAVPDSSILA